MNAYSLLEDLQADVVAALASTPALAGANIIAENEGDMEATILEKLKTLSVTPGGVRGLALVVMLPEVTDSEENLPGPPLQVGIEVQVIEQVLLNRCEAGTNIRSSEAALMALNSLHHLVLGRHVLAAAENPIQPVRGMKKGFVSHSVRLRVLADGIAGPGKPAGISASWADEELTLTCSTEDALIYYTTDGSFPTRTAGLLYELPIPDLETGTTVRAVAYAGDMNPGDCILLTITT